MARSVIQDGISHRQLTISGRHADIRGFCLTALTMALLLKGDKASKLLPKGTEVGRLPVWCEKTLVHFFHVSFCVSISRQKVRLLLHMVTSVSV